MLQVQAWAHTGTMQTEAGGVKEEAGGTVGEEAGTAGGSGTMGEEAGAAGGSGTMGEEAGGEKEVVWQTIQVTDSSEDDSEDDPIVKEEAGVNPKLLLNPYIVAK